MNGAGLLIVGFLVLVVAVPIAWLVWTRRDRPTERPGKPDEVVRDLHRVARASFRRPGGSRETGVGTGL